VLKTIQTRKECLSLLKGEKGKREICKFKKPIKLSEILVLEIQIFSSMRNLACLNVIGFCPLKNYQMTDLCTALAKVACLLHLWIIGPAGI